MACGNAQGMDFPTSVAPFILRGINLFGLDSVYQTIANKKRAWELLAEVFNGLRSKIIFQQNINLKIF